MDNADLPAEAEDICVEQLGATFERDFWGRTIGVEVRARRIFVGKSGVEVLDLAKAENLEGILYVKIAGTIGGFRPLPIASRVQSLETILPKGTTVFVLAQKSDSSNCPAVFRKHGQTTKSVAVWLTKTGAEDFRSRFGPPDAHAVELTREDLERFVKSKDGCPDEIIIEVLP